MAKSDARLHAIGEVDEANCAIAIAIASLDGELVEALTRVQNDLFDLGADLATPEGIAGALRIVPAQVAWLEARIDAITATQPPLTSFVLPGGHPGAAALHLARAVARRAERAAVTAGIGGPALTYLNRLSDFLFVAARRVNESAGGDVLWRPGASRDA